MSSEIMKIKQFSDSPAIKARFEEVLKDRAPQFMASVISAVKGNDALQKCEQNSIWGAAMIAAALDLPINPNLGFSAIVPYAGKAQFQIMTRGFVQLAIRSGQYKNIGVSAVYEDEIKSFDPVYDSIEFTALESRKQREAGEDKKIVGYFAHFELLSGFKKTLYMTKAQILNHAKKYSKTFKAGGGIWATDFDAMGKKTVLKLLLSKFGILSIEMQKAFESEHDIDAIDENGNSVTIDKKDVVEDIIEPEAPKRDVKQNVEPKQTVIVEEEEF